MAKKKAKVAKKRVVKKSHGELFDKHTNLIWLLPIFFIVAIIAVIAIKNENAPVAMNEDSVYENEMMNDDGSMMGEDMMIEDGAVEEITTEETSQ